MIDERDDDDDGRDASKYPEPEDDQPSEQELEDMVLGMEDALATDGCVVEPDGVCPHGHPSWPLRLGLI